MKKFKAGQWVRIEADLELGPALIVKDNDPTRFEVKFSKTQERRLYTSKNPPFKKIEWYSGQTVKISGASNDVLVNEVRIVEGLYWLKTPQGEVCENQIVDWKQENNLAEILRQQKWTHPRAFKVRGECLFLKNYLDQHICRGLASPRIELLPHQLWVANQVVQSSENFRAILCDEVGLGKTIEAGLVLSMLSAQQKVKKVLVLVPPALKIQWLTELYQKFHVRFRLEHEDNLDSQDYRDYVISSLEELEKNDQDLDLLIVDEAHRLTANPETQASLENWVQKAKRVLFLTATPASLGEKAFQKMIHMLSVDESLKPLLFHSKRSELGIQTYRSLEAAFCENKSDWIHKFVGDWVAKKSRDKLFVICETSQQARTLAAQLEKKWGTHFALFHEEMDLVERDRQAAYFSETTGARVLISSEIGGEGRNFQFCHDILLADLPGDPLKIEQRIGRLDRIGQTQKVRVWVPVEESDEEIFELLRDKFKVFEMPWTGKGLEDNTKGIVELLNESVQYTMNYEKMPEVEYRKVDLSQAESLCQSVRKYSQIQVLPLLEQIFEYFGVEVEDFDTQGNIKATASSLMFVESFPGLGPDGEKVFTENRSLALVRNDLAFINVDSPDFYEIIQFYLNSDLGRLSAIVAQEDNWNFAALLAGDKMCVVVDSQKHSLEKWLEKNTLDTVIVPKATQVQQYEKILIPLLERIQSSNPSFRVEAMLLNIT